MKIKLQNESNSNKKQIDIALAVVKHTVHESLIILIYLFD